MEPRRRRAVVFVSALAALMGLTLGLRAWRGETEVAVSARPAPSKPAEAVVDVESALRQEEWPAIEWSPAPTALSPILWAGVTPFQRRLHAGEAFFELLRAAQNPSPEGGRAPSISFGYWKLIPAWLLSDFPSWHECYVRQAEGSDWQSSSLQFLAPF